MKKLLKVLGVLAVLLVLALGAGVWWVMHKMDTLAKRAVEQGGTYALGVTTTVDHVSLGVFSGDLSLSGLKVANPSGFTSPHFLTLGDAKVKVEVDTLKTSVIEIPDLHLKDIDVNLEKGASGANYRQIMDNLAKLRGTPKPPAPGEKEMRFIVHDLTIDKVKVHANLLGAPGQVGQVLNSATKVDLPIDHIELKDVGKTGTGVGGTGVTAEQLSSIVVQAVMAAAAEKGPGIIPSEIIGDLKGAVNALGGLADIPVSVIGKAGETATQIGQKAVEGVGKVLDGAGKAAGDALKNVGDGLSNILGGDKDKKKGK